MPLDSHLAKKSTRSPEWVIKQGEEIKKIILSEDTSKKQDVICWNLYNEKVNEHDFDYLNKYEDAQNNNTYLLPAKVRFIGIVKPRLNRLISQQARRFFTFNVLAVDKESLDRKYKKKIQRMASELEFRVQQVYQGIMTAVTEIVGKRAELQQMLQQEPQNAEHAKQLQALKIAEGRINQMMNLAELQLKRQSFFLDKDLKQIEYKIRFEPLDFREELAQKNLFHLRQVLKIHEESKKAFIERLVTGKEYFYVDYLPGNKYPTFKNMSGLKVYYPKIGNNKWVQDGPWVVVRERLTSSQIKDEFGHLLNDTQIKRIENSYSQEFNNYQRMNSYADNNATFDENSNSFYTGNESGGGVDVIRLWWKNQRKETMIKSPNKHRPGKFFTNYLKEEHRDDISLKEGERIETRYISDIYQGVIIDGDIYVGFKKKPFQLRSMDNMSQVKLPVIGKTYNDITEYPYSFIWATKDLQLLYNIVGYHEELLLALSGVKGFIMDKSQKPDEMSDAEWHYQRKIGIAWIQTIKEGMRVNPVYNQFATYDNTLTQSIMLLGQIKDNLINAVRDITGVTREAEGQTVQTDQVGTYKMATSASNLITEYLFYDHDLIEAEALEMLLNIDAFLVSKNGETRDYVSAQNEQIIFKVPSGLLDSSKYNVIVTNLQKDDQRIGELKQLALREHERNAMPFSHILEMYDTNSLTELKKKLEYFAEEAMKIEQQRFEQSLQVQRDQKLENTKLGKEYDMLMENQRIQLEKMKLQVDAAKQKTDEQIKTAQLELTKRGQDMEHQRKMFEVVAENVTESQMLAQQDKHSSIDEFIRLTELKLNAILQEAGINKDLDLGMEKIAADKQKNKGRSLENVKD